MTRAIAPRSAPRRQFRVPLSGKFAVAFVGLVTLVLLINGAVDLTLNFEEAKRNEIAVQREKAQGAAERVEAFMSEIENQIGWRWCPASTCTWTLRLCITVNTGARSGRILFDGTHARHVPACHSSLLPAGTSRDGDGNSVLIDDPA